MRTIMKVVWRYKPKTFILQHVIHATLMFSACGQIPDTSPGPERSDFALMIRAAIGQPFTDFTSTIT